MLKPATVFTATSSVTTSATQAASLTNDGATFWYCSGFEITYGGATAGSIVKATLSGLQGGTLSYNLAVPTGVTTAGALMVEFNPALAGAGVSTDVKLSLPAFGAGSTNVDACLHGFKGGRTLNEG